MNSPYVYAVRLFSGEKLYFDSFYDANEFCKFNGYYEMLVYYDNGRLKETLKRR